MVIAFLLAQLVLPGPPSSPIQPPGMICASGSCERGPMVYRTSASRSRLVAACDMRSDTCSDGRKIATVRATPVPCEISPGVWEMVGSDEGCYSVRGLETWAATTSYLAYGADLTNTAWIKQHGMSVEKVGSVYRIHRNRGDTGAAFVHQEIAAVTQQETWTAACVMRAGTATQARLSSHRSTSAAFVNLTSEWQVFANTKTLQEGYVPGVSIGPAFTAEDSYIEVAGCWLTKSDIPGRPCWGSEAPVTCDADRHTISTEGWPTEAGEVCITYQDSGEVITRVLLEGRPPTGSGVGTFLQITGTRYRVTVGSAVMDTEPGVVVEGRPVRICFGRTNGNGYITVDGVRYEGGPIPPFEWEPVASIGRGRVSVYQGISGSIRSLTVRSFEEVSP